MQRKNLNGFKRTVSFGGLLLLTNRFIKCKIDKLLLYTYQYNL